jgi:hypothetical protein
MSDESPVIHFDLGEMPDLEEILERNGSLCMDDENDRACLAAAIRESTNAELKQLIEPLARFILQEVPGYPRATKAYPNGMDAAEAAIEAIKEYQQISHALWGLLDHISTAGDAAKSDDAAFRRMVEKYLEQRSRYFQSDGYRLFRVIDGREFPDPEPERATEEPRPEREREFVICDGIECDYYQGDGEWTHVRSLAMRYRSREDAERALDDVDCEKLMRNRLHVYEVDHTGNFVE